MYGLLEAELKPCVVDFWDYFGRFLIQIWGVISTNSILPPKFESKIGSKEPGNRLTSGFSSASQDLDFKNEQHIGRKNISPFCSIGEIWVDIQSPFLPFSHSNEPRFQPRYRLV
jgi:hypothetical protein